MNNETNNYIEQMKKHLNDISSIAAKIENLQFKGSAANYALKLNAIESIEKRVGTSLITDFIDLAVQCCQRLGSEEFIYNDLDCTACLVESEDSEIEYILYHDTQGSHACLYIIRNFGDNYRQMSIYEAYSDDGSITVESFNDIIKNGRSRYNDCRDKEYLGQSFHPLIGNSFSYDLKNKGSLEMALFNLESLDEALCEDQENQS